MNPLKKFKNRRGMTLIEVLCVVTLMSVMLAVAMPDILTESAKMKLTAMDNNARAVAVAVQSKLYSMKNSEYASTNEGDDYALLCKAAFTVENSAGGSESAGGESSKEEGDGSGSESGGSGQAAGGSEGGGSGKEEESGTDADEKKYISNFAIPGNSEEVQKMLTAVKNYLFNSLGMTDIGLLEHGKILIVFNPKTADVTEVFYSENEFALTGILPAPNGKFLEDNVIGYYHGTGGAEIVREKDPVRFLVSGFQLEPELVLKIQAKGEPPEEIKNMPLGIEVFIKNETTPEKKAVGEVCIYSEGIFTQNYETAFVIENNQYKTISPDDYLTFDKIFGNGGMLKFGLDSPLTSKVINWPFSGKPEDDNHETRPYLTHVRHPELISMATSDDDYGLFPRETLGDWLASTKNPFLTVWYRQHATYGVGPKQDDKAMSQEMYEKITNNNLGAFFEARDKISLRVVIHGLKDNGTAVDSTNQNIRVFDDEAFYYEITSDPINPYFYNILNDEKEIEIRSYRELNNVHYAFEQDNKINYIKMSKDITFESFYELNSKVRENLIKKANELKKNGKGQTIERDIKLIWTFMNLGDSFIVDSINTKDKFDKFNNGGFRPFTFDGQGHTIEGVVFGNDNYGNGLFMFAKGCTFENLDIVNTKVWNRSLSSGNFIQANDSNINIKWPSYTYADFQVGGSLVSVAIDCKFTNVRAVINKDKLLATYEPENEKAILDNIPLHRVSNVIAGGLVGAAFGTNDKGTSFTNCASSMRVLADSNAGGQVCAYAGGLIGVAVGNVNVSYSYAAGQLAGYRSGGLIGATFESGNFVEVAENETETNLAYVSSGKTTITNSFTAGQIMRTVREGAGLIAQINGATPEVTYCYSATWWESLPPVAYGTFKGDQNNFFVYQTLVEMPVTVNVAAVFKYSGANNVFSSQDTTDAKGNVVHYAGIPCTVTDLNKKLLPEGKDVSPELSFGSWQKVKETATSTSRWTANGDYENDYYLSNNDTDKVKVKVSNNDTDKDYDYDYYPFPIPWNKENNAEWNKENNAEQVPEFYGDWIKYNARDESTPATAVEEFKGYYYLYFSNTDGASSKADPCMIHQKNVKLSIKDNKVYLNGYYKNAWWNTWQKYGYGNPDVSYSLEEILAGGYYYWANLYGYQEVKDNVIDGKIPDIPNKTPNLNFKYDGDAAKTEVSVSGTDFVFSYAPYYDKDFDPLNPFNEVTNWTKNGNFNLGNSTLCWDFYGYYFMADYASDVTEVKYKKYYIKFDNSVGADTLRRGEGENDGYIYVNEKSFKTALKFKEDGIELSSGIKLSSIKLSSTNVKPSWDSENGVFSVENKKE